VGKKKEFMTSINRREMIGGAVALLSAAHLTLAFAANQGSGADSGTSSSMNLPVKPKDLLSATFTRDLLSKSLVSVAAWHPYPKADEREAWQAIPQDVAGALIHRAELALGTPWESFPATVFLEYKKNGNRSHFERYFFARRMRLGDLVLGECVEGKGRFIDEIVNGVWLTCEETFWGLPAHLLLQKATPGSGLPDAAEPVVDLFAAETGATLSWIHYLLGAQLDKANAQVTRRIQMEAKRRILDPALERDDFFWMFNEFEGKPHHLSNWTPWIDSNWLATTLLLEQDPARRTNAVLKICKSVDQYLEEYSIDGCCEEGPGYWHASPASYFDCCTLLTSATGGVANVLTNPFIRKIAHYIADVHIAGPYFVNYGDASPKGQECGELLYRIGSAVGDKTLEGFGAFNTSIDAVRGGLFLEGQGRLSRALPQVLAAAKVRSVEKADALVRDSWYPVLGLMTAREKEGASEGFFMALQAAPNQRPHAHSDSGSFIVFHDGNPVFIDVGPEAYTAPRYKWSTQSAFHNLPTVGGVMQNGKDKQKRATNLKYFSNDARASVSLNLATAYPAEAGITRWDREITLDRKSNRIRLSEDFQLQRKVPVVLSFMTSRMPSQGEKGKVVLSAADKSVKDVTLTYDASLVVATIEKIDLKDDWLRTAWGETLYRVLLTSAEPTDRGKWMMEIS
jgi:hypothetical protein